MNRRVFSVLFALLLPLLLLGCRTARPNGITQVATFDALLTGVYDGHLSLRELSGYGDFGIGTFDGLDGEMVYLDGTFYQVRSDGKVYRPALSVRTPFASVTAFEADHRQAVTAPMDFEGLQSRVDQIVPAQNRFCALAVHGTFSHVRVRSVPAQKKPYPPLVEVARNQPIFEFSRISGTLVGFRSPDFVKGVNVPGYHVHFLADDLSGGGHVLAFEMEEGILELDTVHEWLNIYMPPESEAFASADLTRDRSGEMESVEKERKP